MSGFPCGPTDPGELADLLAGPVDRAAAGLLGCQLVAGPVTLRLTETEAYAGVGADPASHAHRGRTARNTVMFGPPGHAYVYFTYGMHWCLNVVCGPPDTASAVLLRAGEVVAGLPAARGRRPGVPDRDLARGPARLTRALAVDRAANGVDLLAEDAPLRLVPGTPPDPSAVQAGPRVGVTGGADTTWRYWLATPDGRAEPTVSRYRPAVPRRR
ncbi:DNA-3-methyladenine glycosylase [Actinocatenispora rupis]|uniref:DNA-3-methyladenine glycosylase n=1 Tax=Actinocatenispora rupis TaxID=519421 RepID=UPI0019458732|nr:DNA-3-methyladenine glycosylase [Actinocatenispora rupis]